MKKHIFSMLLLSFGVVTGVFSQSMTISGGNDHGIVICAEGYLYAWGVNQSNIGSGLLGLDPTDPNYPGDQKYYTSPQRVKMDGNLTFSQVTAGSGAFNLALSCTGIVYAWGENTQGQCGQGSTQSTVITEPKPVLCGDAPGYNLDGTPGGPYLGNVTYIAASTAASFAILGDGRVVGWGGKNSAAWCAQGQVSEPIFIKLKDGSDVKNAIHIGAGDDNLLITIDPDGDGMGDLYSVGNWNGRGAVASSNTDCYYAAPVMIGDASDKTGERPLTNVRMAAAADVAGFAVTGDGLVYGWGNCWGGVNGDSKTGRTTQYAHQVISGAYKDISGEEYLTDVKEVAGGQGYAMAVTKEGYLVYWGNAGGPGKGGVIPNPNFKGNDTQGSGTNPKEKGPQFTYYSDGSIVDNAVKIARGDEFGFMVNDKDEYYAFGNNQSGQTGLGSSAESIKSMTRMKIPCETQDACPEGFMVDTIWKCPGTKVELFSGFTTPKGKEDRYYFTWKFNGTVLNTSTSTSSLAERTADPYNITEIMVQDTGRYEVTIEYVGTNVPCNTCVPITVGTYLADKSMTIDTLVTTSCVSKPELSPTAADNLCFKFKSKYTVPSDFAVYAKQTGGTALDTVSLTKANPIGEFCVSGDNVTASDNAPVDTTYTVWLEDITKIKGTMFSKAKSGTDDCYQQYFLHLVVYEDVLLESCEMSFDSYGSVVASATPIIYGAKTSDNDEQGRLIADLTKSTKGKKQTLDVPAAGGSATVEIGIKLTGSARGTNYFLTLVTDVTGGAPLYYSWSGTFPYKDEATGSIMVSNNATEGTDGVNQTTKSGPFGNLIFSKLSSYDCGRMAVTTRLWCPPCNQPDGIIKIEVDGAPRTQDTIYLCEESDAITLSVSGIKKSTEPNAVFDELWFVDKIGTDAQALHTDLKSASSTLPSSIGWKSSKEGQTEKYYIKIRDNEKSDASACFVFDSIVVKHNKKPEIPTIDDIAFCENAASKTALDDALNGSEFAGFTVNWYNSTPLPPLTDLLGRTGGDAGATKPDLESLTATNSPYTFVYSVTDKETGCESDKKTFTVTVYPVPNDPIDAIDPFCVKAEVKLPTASPKASHTVSWYSDKTATTAVSEDLSTLAAGSYDYYYTLTSAAPEKCVSDPIPYTFIIKPYVEIELDSVMSCGVTQVNAKILRPNTASVKWMLDGTTEVTSPIFQTPTYVGNVGKLVGIASAMNYCDTTSLPMDVYVKATASEPTGDLSVTYLKTDADPATKTFKNLLAQNPSVVTEETGYTLVWYDENGTKLSECPTPPYPADNVTDDQEYTYKVSRVNADGCESTPVPVKVMVYLTPAPIVPTVYYCKGSTRVVPLTAQKNIPPTASESDYTLQWYDTDKATKLQSAPTPNVSVKGKTTYYVTQVSNSGAESSPVSADVIVYEVPEPQLDPSNVTKYCAASSVGSKLNAVLFNDAANYDMASDFVWSLKNASGTYEEVSSPIPSLDVQATTVYEYRVHQTYTITSSGELCVGPDVDVPVTVTYVPQLTTQPVLYLKASANNDGTFNEDILTHESQAVSGIVAGATLQWYEDDCTTPIIGTPTPTLDASVPEGEDQLVYYCVSQLLDGCYGKPEKLTVRISDALPPFTYAYHYCEGETMDDLKADCQPQGGKSESDYDIYWYGTTKPASTTTPPTSIGNTFAMNGAVASLDATGGKTELIYYVAQHDKTTDAVSAALPVVITIYPQPVVLPTPPQAVCEENVDMANFREVKNVSEVLSYTYYSPAGSDMGTSLATISGTYGIDAYYTLPVTPSQYVVVNNPECRGTKVDLPVAINDLTDPTISGDISTCPGTGVTLTASATSSDPGTITYQWGGDAVTTAQGSTTDANLVTKNLSTTTGDTYSYTVTATAGACTKEVAVPHVVTIGDGKVIGNMTLVESDNANSPIVFTNAVDRVFYSCGNPVEISVSYDGDSDYEWYDETGTLVGTGSLLTTNSSATYIDKEYTVKFTNQCPTSAKVMVYTIPVSASAVSTEKIEICEGEVFTSSFDYTLKPGETPSITWFHNNAAIGGQVSNVLTLSNTTNQDDGVYSFKIENRGCMAEGVANSLNVRPYIRATIQNDPFIVDRNETETLPIYFTTPVNGVIQSTSWRENETEVFNGNPYVITDVTADHYYEIILSDPDYCSDTLHAIVYVDAKLQLTTSLKDTLCLGTSEILTIDTTGTGNFRRPNGNPMLNITGIIGGISYSFNDKVTKQGDLLQVVVNPEEDAKYVVSFTYGNQSKESEEEVLVIPAISLTVPPVPNVCEGEETTLTVTNVAPEGTTVSWISDPTILEGENSETVRVKPSYKGGVNHQSLYTYQAVAYNAFCNNSKTYSVQVLVDEPLKGQITGISEICEGGQTSFEASSYDATTYMWTTSIDTSFALGDRLIVQPTQTASYYLEMTRGLCSAKDTFVVTVHTNPVISSIDSIGVRDRKITLDPEYGTAPFLYAIDAQPADEKDVKTNLGFVKHVVYVSDFYGCQTFAMFVLEAPEIDIPIIVTPDNNGLNDKWVIPNLAELYPNAIVTIYDRFGKQLAQYLGADSDGWDCTYQGKPLPSTDYWYQVTIEEINKEYVGHFTLIRR